MNDRTVYLGAVTVPNGWNGDEIEVHICRDPLAYYGVWNDRGMSGFYRIPPECWTTSPERWAMESRVAS